MGALSPNLPAADQVLYLHANSQIGNYLDTNRPTVSLARTNASLSFGRTKYVEVGTWRAAASPIFFDLTAVHDFRLWMTRKLPTGSKTSNSANTAGTLYDIRAEILKNGQPLVVPNNVTNFVRRVALNPDKPTPLFIPFGHLPTNVFFARGDVLALRVSAKVSDVGALPTSPGVNLVFDSTNRPSRFNNGFFVIPEISITSAAVSEGDAATATATLTVNLSSPAERTVTAHYATMDGTATVADGDYLGGNGTLTFAPGETTKTIQVGINGDSKFEADESFRMVLSAPSNGVLGTATGVITVRNDDLPPVLSLDSIALVEGNSGTTNAVLTASLSALSGLPASFDFATADGTATFGGDDYVSTNGTLVIPPGETVQQVVVPVIGDRRFEPDETFLVALTNVLNATLNPAPSVVTIRNDDAPEGAPTITSLPNLITLNSNRVTISGAVNAGNAQVQVNGIVAQVNGGNYSADIQLREGNNTITVVVTDESGNVTTVSITVTVDTTPPRLSIDSPRDGAVLSEPVATVTGIINDTVVGTVNGDQATVQVNGVDAMVANRTYAVMNIPLVPGTNVITAVGSDHAGNTRTASIRVFYNTETAARIQAVSGDGQSGQIGQLLPQPLVVRALDTNGNPCPNKKIIFKVTQNDGLITGPTNTARSLIMLSGADGLAQVQFRLGTRAGAGNNQVSASIVGFEGEAMFCATATPAPPGLLVPDAGNNQIGVVGQPLPKPLVTIVVDSGNNRLHNVPITFTVKEGGGLFAGQNSITINSDSDGRSLAVLTLGPQAGNDNHVVEANFPGNTGLPVTFVASGRVAGNPTETSISGVVLDNSDIPVPGCTLRILGQATAVLSDSNGFFQIKPAPVGAVRLIADGATVTRPGTWVWLQFDLVTIAGQDNDIGRPVRLLPIDMANSIPVTATQGGTLTLPHAPGCSLKIASNSVLFPDGTRSGRVSVTVVHPDKMPDPPSFGQQPRFLVSIQPANAIFNPPAAMCIPNLDGLPPGQKTDMYSYDHDMERFISIGTGTVSEDGMMVCSDPGNGVIKGGWHCGGNPATAGSAGTCPDCQKCDGDKCVADVSKNGQTAAKDKCKICENGSLVAIHLDPAVEVELGGFGPPSEGVDAINDALELLEPIGIIAEVNLLQIALTGSQKECCEATLGKGLETSGSVQGNFGGFSVKGKVWPPGPIPTFGPKTIDVFGLAELTVKAQFVGGVFIGLEGSVTGEIGYRKKECALEAADRNGCVFAELKTSLTPSLSAEIGGNATLEVDCIFCDKTTIELEASFIAGELSWPFDVSNVSYNKDKCGTGLSGGLLQFNPGSFKTKVHFAGSYEIEGFGKRSVDVTINFLDCEIRLSGVTCD